MLAWLRYRCFWRCLRRRRHSFSTSIALRPPADVPGAGQPAAEPCAAADAPAPATPRGRCCSRCRPGGGTGAVPRPRRPCRPGRWRLRVSARFGRDLPAITGGLHWRVYPGQARSQRRLPPDQGRQERDADIHAAARQLRGPCRLRPRERDQGGATACGRADARGVRNSGRRTAHRRQGRRRPHPARPDFVRSLQGQPVRARRQAADRAVGADRRRRSGARRAPITSSRTTATPTRWCAPTSACRPPSSPT